MITSRYLPDTDLPAFDHCICLMTRGMLSDSFNAIRGQAMEVAIENPCGMVYRAFTCIGLASYLKLVSTIAGMGFKDTLADVLFPCDGYDSRFILMPRSPSLLGACVI